MYTRFGNRFCEISRCRSKGGSHATPNVVIGSTESEVARVLEKRLPVCEKKIATDVNVQYDLSTGSKWAKTLAVRFHRRCNRTKSPCSVCIARFDRQKRIWLKYASLPKTGYFKFVEKMGVFYF